MIRRYNLTSRNSETSTTDECANVKFVDHLEITRERGHDNRPATESEHARLHGREP